MWMRIHDILEENGIDTMLANPYKTKIMAEAKKIKSDKLDARILSDLLRAELILNHMHQREKIETKGVLSGTE